MPPKQYQQGYTEFYKLKFKLTPDVLIPRPETELLVDEVIAYAKGVILSETKDIYSSPAAQNDRVTIIDVGTGSGCIAISVAKNLPQVKIFALDISDKALKVAEQNAKFHRVEKRVLFLQSDLLSVIANKVKQSNSDSAPTKIASSPAPRNDVLRPDVIVANLPYISSAKLMLIDPMVRDFEPKLALDGGIDGFELYREMFAQMIKANLLPKILIAEIDETQGEIALAEAKRFFPQAKIEIKKDLAKMDRILLVKFPNLI